MKKVEQELGLHALSRIQLRWRIAHHAAVPVSEGGAEERKRFGTWLGGRTGTACKSKCNFCYL